jgi:hypothetical protein
MCLDHYEDIIYMLHPRPVVLDNIDRLLKCGDPDYGGALYICPCCGEIKYVPYRCHSKLCSTCGAMYSLKRAQAMQSIMIDVTHRHIVFTIDEELLRFYNSELQFVSEPGEFQLMVGPNSRDVQTLLFSLE